MQYLQTQSSEEMCEEEGGAKKKWICEYCTFSNWPSSMKCSMCRGKKPARLCGSENIYSAVHNTNNQRGKPTSFSILSRRQLQMYSGLQTATTVLSLSLSDCKMDRSRIILSQSYSLSAVQIAQPRGIRVIGIPSEIKRIFSILFLSRGCCIIQIFCRKLPSVFCCYLASLSK